MTDDSRAQGGLICVAVVILGALFLAGLLAESYWAIALPVAGVVGLVLGRSELLADIFAPTKPQGQLPVVVVVHGGG